MKDVGGFRKFLRFIFGYYTLPGFFSAIYRSFKEKKVQNLVKNVFKSFLEYLKKYKLFFILSISLIFFLIAGYIGFSIWKAYQPQPITIEYRILPPASKDFSSDDIEPLHISFFGSAARPEDLEHVIEHEIIIEPEIAGVWTWSDDTQLTFSPEEDWAVGTVYKFKMPKQLFPDDIEVDYDFKFSTEDFSARITNSEFYIDPTDGSIKRVLATISCNYPIDPESLEGKVQIRPDIRADSGRLELKDYDFTISYDEFKLNAYIVSESIGVPSQNVDMHIKIDRGLESSIGGGTFNRQLNNYVTIPGADDFAKVYNITHQLVKTPDQKYDQVFTIETSGDVAIDELLNNIEIYMLPVDRPELPGIEANEDHNWNRVDEMVPEVLELSSIVEIESIPNELDYSSVNSFRFSVDPERYIYIKLSAGTKFYGDYYLSNDFEKIIDVKDYPKEIEMLSEGAILSLTGDKKISILTRGVSNIEYNIGRVRPDDINHLVSQSNGSLSNFSFTNRNFTEYNITEQYTEYETVQIRDRRTAEFFSFDFSSYLNTIPEQNLRYGLYFFEVSGIDNESQYTDKRLIMITDLGFFVKNNHDGSKDVFVQSLATGAPVAGATVEVLGRNGNPIVAGVTRADGRLQFPSLVNYDRESSPTTYIVKKGNDMSFMPYSALDRQLDYSNYNVGGVRGATDTTKINAFLFSDRGIYRPGDEVRVGMIVKAGDWNIDLYNTPLECKITDSRGSEVYTEQIRLSSAGIEEIKYRTEIYSPTGVYNVKLYVIKEDDNDRRVFLGATSVKIEEFLPDNLKVETSFMPAATEGWVSPEELKAMVTVRNLFGTPAAGNRVVAELVLRPGYRRFRGYDDYTFFDPFLQSNSYEEFLREGITDDEGHCEFDIDLSKFENASYNLGINIDAFEKGGGRNVSSYASIFVSPLEYLIGYKPDGDLHYINKGSERNVQFIAVDSNLNHTSVSNLNIIINEIRYVSVLVKQPNGVFKYQSVKKSYQIESNQLEISAEGYILNLPTLNGGEYEVVVIDNEEIELNSFKYTVIGSENIERSLDRTAELEILIDKTDFEPGEAVELFIKAPYAGSGLITIERDKVYNHIWFTAEASSTQRITIPVELEGNGYINVAFVRALDSTEIYMSPMCYGTVPFSVSKANQTNEITLDVPAESKPGEPFNINYSSSKPGKIIIFAVDEGILQVAGYSTPDPIAFFFKKRALEVSTSQIMDLLLPEFSVVQSLAAMGGGGPGEMLSRNLNPFQRKQREPVAYWSGILDCGPETRTTTFQLPDYFNGSMRIMAVAVSEDALGAEETSALVRDTFILQPTMPLAAVPNDEFEVSVTVGNNQKGSGDNAEITLTAESTSNLTILSGANQTLYIDEGSDTVAYFTVRANGLFGNAEIEFIASRGGEISEFTETMSIRPSVPYRTIIHGGMVRRDKQDVDISRQLYSEFATKEISMSYLPIGLAKGLTFYLERYPYNCTEQITSSSYPMLYPELFEQLDFSVEEGNDSVARTISILQARQKSDGSFGMWTSLSYDNNIITTYVVQFLIEAKKKGHFVPDSMLTSAINKVKVIAQSDETDWYSVVERSYAVYTLTMNEIVTTNYIEDLRDDLDEYHDDWETSFCGLFLASSYKMLQQEMEANQLLRKIRRSFKNDESYLFLNSLCYSSFYLHVVSAYFPNRLKDLSEELLVSISDDLEAHRYTTFSANFALMGIESYLDAVPGADLGNYTVTAFVGDESEEELLLTGDALFSSDIPLNSDKLEIRNREQLNLFYQIIEAGFDREAPEEPVSNGIEIYREFTDLDGNRSESFKQGDTIIVKVRFKTMDQSAISNVAIVDMIPAGFEVDIASIRESENYGDWRADYVDIREDRVVMFGNVTSSYQEFSYQVKAVSKGTFIVPPLFAEAMYDNEVWALRPHVPIEIE